MSAEDTEQRVRDAFQAGQDTAFGVAAEECQKYAAEMYEAVRQWEEANPIDSLPSFPAQLRDRATTACKLLTRIADKARAARRLNEERPR